MWNWELNGLVGQLHHRPLRGAPADLRQWPCGPPQCGGCRWRKSFRPLWRWPCPRWSGTGPRTSGGGAGNNHCVQCPSSFPAIFWNLLIACSSPSRDPFDGGPPSGPAYRCAWPQHVGVLRGCPRCAAFPRVPHRRCPAPRRAGRMTGAPGCNPDRNAANAPAFPEGLGGNLVIAVKNLVGNEGKRRSASLVA